MDIRDGGIDLFYVDESGSHGLYVVSSVRIPFVRFENGAPRIVWNSYLDAADVWRRQLSKTKRIRYREELHGVHLIGSRNRYHKQNRNLYPDEALEVYSYALNTLGSIVNSDMTITVSASDSSRLFGHTGISAALLALFQRLRTYCENNDRNGMIFFDEGHSEYTSLYRKSVRYLPTGIGGKNKPLDMFIKDGNIKVSHMSYFIQIADLVAHAALLKRRYEAGNLQAKRVSRQHHTIYDQIPATVVNMNTTTRRGDGIAVVP